MVSNEKWFGASAGFYNGVATQSLRITGNGYLNHEHTSAPTLDTKGTVAFWIKLNNNDDRNYVIQNYQANNNNGLMDIRFGGSVTNQGMHIGQYGRTPYTASTSEPKQRDFSAWYHCLVSFDSTSSTASERQMKIFINGTQVTTGTFGAINQNDKFPLTAQGSANGGVTIGRHVTVGYYIDAYFADFYVIDGQALTPDSFTEIKNGICIPKAYDGTYGNNGFRLEFKQTGTSADASGLGADTSGNANHFTVNSLSDHDSNLPDSPENNFAILNKADARYGSFSEGNLRDTYATTGELRRSTHASKTGKWYVEVNCIGSGGYNLGIYPTEGFNKDSDPNYGVHYRGSTGQKVVSNSVSSYGATYGINDIIGIAVDMDNNTVTFYKNNVSQGSISYTIDTDHAFHNYSASGSSAFFNFGQDSSFGGNETAQGNTDANGQGDFYYSPPSGFLALCSNNLDDTTLSPNQSEQADDHFNTVLWSGNSTARDISVGFEADWVWTKMRSHDNAHYIYDSSRGDNTDIYSNLTQQESTTSGRLTFGNTDGFSLGTDAQTNGSGYTFVGWCWNGEGSAPTKTYKVVVVSDSGNKYRFRNSADSATFAQSAVTLDLQEGGTYVFDWSDSTAQGHPIRFSTTSDGTHGGGSAYTTGVVNDDSNYKTTITVAGSAPTLYYYCSNHSGMGGQINTNTTHGSTNFDGSLLSVVQSNQTSGFSISKYTGNLTAGATYGHGLGTAPDIVITKSRSVTGKWIFLTTAEPTKYGYLHLSDAFTTLNMDDRFGNNTSVVLPSSTVVTIGTNVDVNTSGTTYISYCFSEIEGYSKFGSYIGNGSTDGTFVYTGFRPAWVMIKSTSTGHFLIHDSTRSIFNVIDEDLFASVSSAESDNSVDKDFLSNGFKHRVSHSSVNANGTTYIYMAFAEQPFKFSNGR